MLHILFVTLLCLFQTIGCDSTDNSEPEISGKWIGTVMLPNSPLIVAVHFKLDIIDNSVQGSGTFDLEEYSIFRTTEIEITGSFSFPVVNLEFRSGEDRIDVFVGIMQESRNTIMGIITFPRMPLPELSLTGQPLNPGFGAVGGDGEITFERVTE